jgi:hypothetical protein
MLIGTLLPLALYAQKPDYVLVIHGGAGSMNPERMSAEQVEKRKTDFSKPLMPVK